MDEAITAERRPSPFLVLLTPDQHMDRQARVGRTLWLLLFAWLCSLLLAAAMCMRVDASAATLRNLEKSGELKSMSDRQIADETVKAERVFQVLAVAKGAALPPLQLGLQCLAVVVLSWFLRGRLKGSAVAPVAAAALLPCAVADLVDAAAVWRHTSLPPEGAVLAPRTLSAVMQLAAHPLAEPWIKLGNALDFYSFWAAWMLGFGLAAAAQVPKKRAVACTLIGWVCYRLVTRVAIGLV